jgi:hypothetical protein
MNPLNVEEIKLRQTASKPIVQAARTHKVELVSQAEYARRRGVDPTSVRDAVRSGRITLIDRKIDPVIADAQWLANTRPRASAEASNSSSSPPLSGPAGAADSLARVSDYQLARASREDAEAKIAQLKLAELQGLVIRRDAVRSKLTKTFATIREGLLQIPARLSPVLAAESDPAKIHDYVMNELRQVLFNLTEPPQ